MIENLDSMIAHFNSLDRLHRERISELERTFQHSFVSPEQSEADPHRERCKQCGLNLRDAVHVRAKGNS